MTRRSRKTAVAEPTPTANGTSNGHANQQAAPAAAATQSSPEKDPFLIGPIRFRPEWVQKPWSDSHFRWLVAVSCACWYNLILILPRTVFHELQDPPQVYAFAFFDYVCDFVYVLDIFVKATTGYLENGILVKEPRKLFRHYFRSSAFAMDVIAVLPTDLFWLITGWHSPYPVLRLNRLIKLSRVGEFYYRAQTRLDSPNTFRLIWTILTMIVVVHLNACVYYGVSDLIGIGSNRYVYPGRAGWRFEKGGHGDSHGGGHGDAHGDDHGSAVKGDKGHGYPAYGKDKAGHGPADAHGDDLHPPDPHGKPYAKMTKDDHSAITYPPKGPGKTNATSNKYADSHAANSSGSGGNTTKGAYNPKGDTGKSPAATTTATTKKAIKDDHKAHKRDTAAVERGPSLIENAPRGPLGVLTSTERGPGFLETTFIPVISRDGSGGITAQRDLRSTSDVTISASNSRLHNAHEETTVAFIDSTLRGRLEDNDTGARGGVEGIVSSVDMMEVKNIAAHQKGGNSMKGDAHHADDSVPHSADHKAGVSVEQGGKKYQNGSTASLHPASDHHEDSHPVEKGKNNSSDSYKGHAQGAKGKSESHDPTKPAAKGDTGSHGAAAYGASKKGDTGKADPHAKGGGYAKGDGHGNEKGHGKGDDGHGGDSHAKGGGDHGGGDDYDDGGGGHHIAPLIYSSDFRNDSLLKKYSYCLYWSVKMMTSKPYELFNPTTNIEFIFHIADAFLGIFMFASIVGEVDGIIEAINKASDDFKSHLDSVKQYINMRKVGKEMESRVVKWFDYIWANNGQLDEESVLSVLPEPLRMEIARHVHLDVLKKVPLFQGVDEQFLLELAEKLKFEAFCPGDYICRKGDIGREIYVLRRGLLNVIGADGVKVLVTLKSGVVFGELSLLNVPGSLNGNRRTVTVRSVGYADLFSLSKESFWSCLEEYPDVKAQLMEKAKAILRKDNLINEEAAREAARRGRNFKQVANTMEEGLEIVNGRLEHFWKEQISINSKLIQDLDKLERRITRPVRRRPRVTVQKESQANSEVTIKIDGASPANGEQPDQEERPPGT